MTLLILVVDDEPDVENLFRQQFRRELRAGRFVMEFAQSAPAAPRTGSHSTECEPAAIGPSASTATQRPERSTTSTRTWPACGIENSTLVKGLNGLGQAPPFSGLHDVRLLARRAAIGTMLTAEQLLEVLSALVNRSLLRFLY